MKMLFTQEKKNCSLGNPKIILMTLLQKTPLFLRVNKKKSHYETSGTISMCQDLNRDVLVKECDTKPKNTYTH